MKVLLVGNYHPDKQQSMIRYAELCSRVLKDAGCAFEIAYPARVMNPSHAGYQGWSRYLGYIDKLFLAPSLLQRKAKAFDVVHVLDHSNAHYIPKHRGSQPWVVTCHDLIAVRGALGELPEYSPTRLGHHLQAMILAGLKRADAIACVSMATAEDVRRLVGETADVYPLPNALNYRYQQLPSTAIRQRLALYPQVLESPFILHVGNDHPRKNRSATVRALAQVKNPAMRLVLVGTTMAPEVRTLAGTLGVSEQLIELGNVGNDILEALYNAAVCLMFPSRHEGFGWPIVEAQACGCPVVCTDAEPMREVAGGAALLADPDDINRFALHIQALLNGGGQRTQLVHAGLSNAARYSEQAMAKQMQAIYEQSILSLASRASVRP